jgi:hypothetical protein
MEKILKSCCDFFFVRFLQNPDFAGNELIFMDKYETDELHIPNMFQGTIKVCYLTVITILSLIVILL